MRSFVFALIGAVLANLCIAAPVALPDSHAVSVSPVLEGFGNSSLIPSGNGQVKSADDQLESIAKGAQRRDTASEVNNTIKDIQSKVHTRGSTLSVDAIFIDLSSGIQNNTETLTSLDSANLTVSLVTDIVASLKTPLVNAVADLQALVGLNAGAILASSSNNGNLTIPQVAAVVSADINLVLGAAGHVLNITVDADVSEDVKVALVDLGNTVTNVVQGVVALVDGLPAALGPLLAPIDGIIAELGLTDLISLLGLVL